MDNIEKSLDHFFQRLGHTPGPWIVRPNRLNLPIQVHAKHGQGFICEPDHQNNIDRTMADCTLIAQSPDMLRTLCRTYLWMLVNIRYRGTLTLDQTLADLRNQINEATGIECQQVQNTFEQYATWIQAGDVRPEREELADQRDPETKIFNAMENGAEDWDDRP